MKTYLVTGPIGGGKSSVCRHLAARGFRVYDCDSSVKAMYESVPGLKARIEDALGISWDMIGIIFSDEQKRLKLESIVYPLLTEDILKWKKAAGDDAVFIESAIALDKPALDGLYDEVILVRAPYEQRAARNPKAVERDSIQSYDESRVNYTIDNDSTLEELFIKTDKLLCRLI